MAASFFCGVPERILFCSGDGGLAGVGLTIRVVSSDKASLIGGEKESYRRTPVRRPSPELWTQSSAFPLGLSDVLHDFVRKQQKGLTKEGTLHKMRIR